MILLHKKSIVTIDVFYYLPEYTNILQEFVWQTEDIVPEYPRVHQFLNYWKENIKAPRGGKDFSEIVEFINNNSSKFGIHKDHIAIGGAGAGAWIVLGALHEMVTRKTIKMVEAAFFISPIADDVLSKIEPQQVDFWEEKWVNYNKGFF